MNATIFGRVGQSAEVKDINGTSMAKFSLALNFYQKGKDKGTQWVNVSFFGTRAEKLAPYITKGSVLSIAGDLRVRTYEKSGGETGVSLDMNAEGIALLGGGQKREEEEPESEETTDEETSL